MRMNVALFGCVFLALVGCESSGANKAANGFRPIFDGTTLANWKSPDMSYWRVEDGAITGEVTKDRKPRENNFIVYQGRPVGDFELKFKFRILGPHSNSGMQFRSEVKQRGLVYGYQADMSGDGACLGSIYDEYGRRGRLSARGERTTYNEAGEKTTEALTPPQPEVNVDLSQWNEYHIIAKGDHITLKLNGVTMTELIDQDTARKRSSGVLAMPIIPEEMKVQYKEIMLKRME